MKVIGITGGIGSGKTTVCRVFEAIGIPVFYADDEAKKLYSDPIIKSKVVNTFGAEIYSEDKINKELLAKIVFNDATRLKSLENILHPALASVFGKWKSDHAHYPLVAKEAAILIESGSYQDCDEIVLVQAPEAKRIERVTLRDGSSPDEVKKRIQAQMPEKAKEKFATLIIQNDERTLISKEIEAWIESIK